MAEIGSPHLVDGHAEEPVLVPATIIRDFPPARLEEVEKTWMPARKVVAEELAQEDAGGEHGHWDWRNKIASAQAGRHRIVAVECSGEVQGLMALLKKPRPASLGDQADRVLYVDFLEAAPWNLRRKSARPKFLRVGILLIREAVAMSLEEGLQGRIGLHSLPQSEGFYLKNCGMTRLGPDPLYYDLTYFEFTQEQAAHLINPERPSL